MRVWDERPPLKPCLELNRVRGERLHIWHGLKRRQMSNGGNNKDKDSGGCALTVRSWLTVVDIIFATFRSNIMAPDLPLSHGGIPSISFCSSAFDHAHCDRGTMLRERCLESIVAAQQCTTIVIMKPPSVSEE